MARNHRLHLRLSPTEQALVERAATAMVAADPAAHPNGLDLTTYARIVVVEAAARALGEVPPPSRRSRRRKFPGAVDVRSTGVDEDGRAMFEAPCAHVTASPTCDYCRAHPEHYATEHHSRSA